MSFENFPDDGDILDRAKILFRPNMAMSHLREFAPETISTPQLRKDTNTHLDRMRLHFNRAERFYFRSDMVMQAVQDICKGCAFDPFRFLSIVTPMVEEYEPKPTDPSARAETYSCSAFLYHMHEFARKNNSQFLQNSDLSQQQKELIINERNTHFMGADPSRNERLISTNAILEDGLDTLHQFNWGEHMPWPVIYFEMPAWPIELLLRANWLDVTCDENAIKNEDVPSKEMIYYLGSVCDIDMQFQDKVGVLVVKNARGYVYPDNNLTYFFCSRGSGFYNDMGSYRPCDESIARFHNRFEPFYVPDCSLVISPSMNKRRVMTDVGLGEESAMTYDLAVNGKFWGDNGFWNDKNVYLQESCLTQSLYGLASRNGELSKKAGVLLDKSLQQCQIAMWNRKQTKSKHKTSLAALNGCLMGGNWLDDEKQNYLHRFSKDNWTGVATLVVNKLIANVNWPRLVEYQGGSPKQPKKTKSKRKKSFVVTQPTDEVRYKTIYLPRTDAHVVRPYENKESNAHNRKAFNVMGHTRCYPTDVTNCQKSHDPNDPSYKSCGWCDKHQRYCHTIFVKPQVRGNPKLGWIKTEREVRFNKDFKS